MVRSWSRRKWVTPTATILWPVALRMNSSVGKWFATCHSAWGRNSSPAISAAIQGPGVASTRRWGVRINPTAIPKPSQETLILSSSPIPSTRPSHAQSPDRPRRRARSSSRAAAGHSAASITFIE